VGERALVVALLLGIAAARGAVDPGLHGMAGVIAAALAIASHVRRGGGWDFLAVVLLVATVGAGAFGPVGTATGALHVGLALTATGLSAGLHLLGGLGVRTVAADEVRG
jgi:hypothetical protein